jgi:RND family efflux transporter MFP subunit
MARILSMTVLISCLTIFSCKEKKPPPPQKIAVNLYTVSSQHVTYYDQYPSTTEALSQVNLMPQVQGYVTGIFFKEGSKVKKGQKLYEIDQRLYNDAYEQAVANLKVTQGTLEQSQQDADRYVYLNKYHAVAKQLYDHAIITLDNSKNSVKAAEQTVKTAKTNLGYSIIYAPFDGTIGFSQVKLGNLVVVGQTVLNTISTNDPIAVDFYINEKQLPHFEAMEQDKNSDLDSLFTMLLPNNTLYPHLGKISIIDRAVDPQTGTIRVRLVFPNPHDALKAGMSCVVRVHNEDTSPQIVIPNRAVVEQMGEYFVFIVKDTVIDKGDSSGAKKESHKSKADTAASKGPQLLAFEKKIQLGQTIGPNVVITKGLTDGEKIIVDGIQQLHDGVAVNPGKARTPGEDSTGHASDSGGAHHQ